MKTNLKKIENLDQLSCLITKKLVVVNHNLIVVSKVLIRNYVYENMDTTQSNSQAIYI